MPRSSLEWGLEHHFQLRGLNADGLVAVFDQERALMIFGCRLISASPFGWSGSSMCQLSLRPLLRPLAGLAANSHFPGCRPCPPVGCIKIGVPLSSRH